MSEAQTGKFARGLAGIRAGGGWLLVALGLSAAGYSIWAFVQSRAYLDEVEASGQVVETFDAVNYLMTSSGLYLLLGVLVLAQGGLYLVRVERSPRRDDSATQAHRPVEGTTPEAPSAPPQVQQRHAGVDDDELDELLRHVDDQQK